eukprot:TRINITY_DN516_c0_g1_i1.p1 TRINITY_DN516_c0_g1~~TRINITY_DN516_c0_g1_i1.p1  ORF type:complete len:551 (+),score=110.57 TRINITY_DN516_c0_g1_i1:124-1776(+)
MQGRGRGRPDGTAGYRSKAAAAATGARAMWFWKSCKDLSDVDPAAWQAYLASESAELEAARERGDAAVNLGKYTVHIAALMQICNKDKSRQRRVIRAVGVRDLTSAEGQQALARTFAGPAPSGAAHAAVRSRSRGGPAASATSGAAAHGSAVAAAARRSSVAPPPAESAAEWYFNSGGDGMSASVESPWQPYTVAESQKLEKAFQTGAAVAVLNSYVVYFAVMIQTRAADASRQRRVIRTVGTFRSPEWREQFADYARRYKTTTAGRKVTTQFPVGQLTGLEEGMQVESKDVHGTWWRIHILAASADGTHPAMVYDRIGTLWEGVHIANCRPIGAGAATLQAPVAAASTPAGWDTQEGNLLLVELPPTSEEYNAVAARQLFSLVKAKNITVSRIQNHMLHKRFMAEAQIMAEWNGAPPAERLLWHGTGENHPKMVYNGQDGFDTRFCTGGMWGRATYFAELARYSDSYAHKEGPNKMLILAQVLVGDSVKLDPDRSLCMPPEKPAADCPAGKAEVMRYDSVNGVALDTTVYMVYANGRAYPKYLVQYTTG